MLKICSNNRFGDEMENDNTKNQTIEKEEKSIDPAQHREKNNASVTGRPDINEISKRNEEAARQERKSFYIITGKIALLVIVVIFLVYFLAK